MKYLDDALSEKHKALSSIIRKKERIGEAKELFFSIHSQLNPSSVYGGEKNKVDILLNDLSDGEYAVMPGSKDETIAWIIWHIARIEDLTMNMLVAKGEQVLDNRWQLGLGIETTDTGNAMSDDEIMDLSHKISIPVLIDYRNAVALRTRHIVQALKPEDMKRKVDDRDLNRILQCGGVTNQENSIWLLDFWGKKDVAGILLMPPTRHVMLHLNYCFRIKEEIRKKNKYFMS